MRRLTLIFLVVVGLLAATAVDIAGTMPATSENAPRS